MTKYELLLIWTNSTRSLQRTPKHLFEILFYQKVCLVLLSAELNGEYDLYDAVDDTEYNVQSKAQPAPVLLLVPVQCIQVTDVVHSGHNSFQAIQLPFHWTHLNKRISYTRTHNHSCLRRNACSRCHILKHVYDRTNWFDAYDAIDLIFNLVNNKMCISQMQNICLQSTYHSVNCMHLHVVNHLFHLGPNALLSPLAVSALSNPSDSCHCLAPHHFEPGNVKFTRQRIHFAQYNRHWHIPFLQL